jgi:hypothetical protein
MQKNYINISEIVSEEATVWFDTTIFAVENESNIFAIKPNHKVFVIDTFDDIFSSE